MRCQCRGRPPPSAAHDSRFGAYGQAEEPAAAAQFVAALADQDALLGEQPVPQCPPVDHDQVQVRQRVEDPDDGVPGQEAAVGIVGVAEHGGPLATGPDEPGERGGSSVKPCSSGSGNMSTRLPVSIDWSVHRPKVGTGVARNSATSRWSIQVMSSVDPLPMVTVWGFRPRTVQSSAVMVSAELG